MMARVVSVNISKEKGTVKEPVQAATLQEGLGIPGDAHGGDGHRQLSLLALESIQKLQAAAPSTQLSPGVFAENITTEGIILHSLPVGTRLQVGDALVEVTQIGKECHQGCEIRKLVGDCVMPREGVFAKVLRGGQVRPGGAVIRVGGETP